MNTEVKTLTELIDSNNLVLVNCKASTIVAGESIFKAGFTPKQLVATLTPLINDKSLWIREMEANQDYDYQSVIISPSAPPKTAKEQSDSFFEHMKALKALKAGK